MFELRNENEVWYKADDMTNWIHYGHLFVVEPVEKEKFVIKRFNISTGEYEIYTGFDTYLYNDTEYVVTDGYFIVPLPEEKPPIYQPNNAELTIMEMQADMYEQQEQNNFTMMESLADIYESFIGGNAV